MDSVCRRTELDTFWLPRDEDTGNIGDPWNPRWRMETYGVLLVWTVEKKTNRVFQPSYYRKWAFSLDNQIICGLFLCSNGK